MSEETTTFDYLTPARAAAALAKTPAPAAQGLSKPVAYRAWFDADNGARWLFTLWPEEERLDVTWEPLYTAPPSDSAVIPTHSEQGDLHDSDVKAAQGLTDAEPEPLDMNAQVEICRAAQIAFNLGTYQSFERALIRETERAILAASRAASLTTAARDVLAERQRQVEPEGMTHEGDDRYMRGELVSAAACYALNAATWLKHPSASRADYTALSPINRTNWPWYDYWWKPRNPRRDAVRAAALLLAEIERIDRAASRTTPTPGEAK